MGERSKPDEVFVVDEGVVVAVATASILLAEPGDDVTLADMVYAQD